MISKLKQFREILYAFFPKRRDAIMNLLDALASHGQHCRSVVELSQAACFERQYSSITDAIADGLSQVDWQAVMKLVYKTTTTTKDKQVNRFLVDCTCQPRPYAHKLADRTIIHAPNPAPGNKPICVGHQYSVVTLLPPEQTARDKHWVIPLGAQRVNSTQKGNEVGMQQIVDCIDTLGLQDQLSISIADSLYGTKSCRMTASTQKNLIHLFRLNSKRNLFCPPKATGHPRGRKKEFGDKMVLSSPDTHPICDEQAQTTWVNRRGKSYQVTIQCWRNMRLRGSRKFRSSQHPLDLLCVRVCDAQGNALFKRPLWLAVAGERRNELGLIGSYKNYVDRYDIEHFFRFGKQKLLMASYQTPDLIHEQQWWQLCLLAYNHLYLANTLVPLLPRPWERYLPEFQHPQDKPLLVSASQTQRGFNKILKEIGSPAADCVARGKARGRIKGENALKREKHPIIFKNKKTFETEDKSILSSSESTVISSNPQTIETLISSVRSTISIIDISPEKFAQMLIDSG